MSFLTSVSNAVAGNDGGQQGNPGMQQGNPGGQGNTHNNDVNAALLAMLQGNQQQQTTQEESPEDFLTKFFTPDEKDHKDETFDPNQIFAGVDPEKLKEAYSKTNYVEGLFTPELAEKIAAGGQDAVTAMAQVMNSMAQKLAFENLQVSAKLTTSGLGAASNAWNQSASTTLRDTNITAAIKETDPMFNSPLLAPVVDKLKAAIVSKQPNATPQEVQEITKKALVAIRGNQQQQQQQQQQEENKPFDWDSFFAPK